MFPTSGDPSPPRLWIASSAPVPLNHVRVPGDPRLALASRRDSDLIVVGPRGRGLLKSLHLGSTAEWLMHAPPAPLLIARHGRPTRRVVVCADGSHDSNAAVSALLSLPRLPTAEVTVVTVPEFDVDADTAATTAAARIGERAGSVRRHVVTIDDLTVFHNPRDEILRVVETWPADVVVLGTRGITGWSEARRAGSIASSLAELAPCSVLMAHQRQHASSA